MACWPSSINRFSSSSPSLRQDSPLTTENIYIYRFLCVTTKIKNVLIHSRSSLCATSVIRFTLFVMFGIWIL
ncbi:hypothetical protein CC78DRAFT_324136 [Lojkania enalia]|uniref:Uncharacterized protein n=1 Tax=Lojkania enalia TaxID=147567 RepID=A0A9P4K6Z0_9PLEO|nr:hypothetical protein CC78DRAFT_324136 [Didymosphaeria enalia]